MPNEYLTIKRTETIHQLKAILGAEYCDWEHSDFVYTLIKMANDITHFKTDNQVWYDKSQELQEEASTHLQALDKAQEWHERQKKEITEQKDRVIQEKEQTIAHLNQTNQTLTQEYEELQNTKQTLKNELTQTQEKLHSLQNTLNQTHEQLTQTQTKSQTLTRENNTLTGKIEDQSQRILALEADKQDLIHQLSQAKQTHQNHLTQEKTQLTQEIQLIKEVIHG